MWTDWDGRSGSYLTGSAVRTNGPLSLQTAVIPPEQPIEVCIEYPIQSDAYRKAPEAMKMIDEVAESLIGDRQSLWDRNH